MFKLSKDRWLSIGKGALIAGGGAALAFLAVEIKPEDFGSPAYGALFAAVFAIVINFARKALDEWKDRKIAHDDGPINID